jgi:hypothetical protein
VVKKTVLPRSRMPHTRSQIARRDYGSNPVVSSSRHHLWIIDQRKSNKQPLLLASGEIHKPGIPLMGETELLK